MHFLIVANPFARRFSEKKLNFVKNFLNRKKLNFSVIISKSKNYLANNLPQILNEFTHDHVKLIIFGGDGTINNICNIIANNNYTNISIGIIPSGTANILAKEMNYSFNLEKNLYTIINSQYREIKLSKINEYYFIFTCGIGFDAMVVNGVNNKLKKKTGEFAYFVEGLKKLYQKKFYNFSFKIDKISEFEAESIIVNRIQKYAINKKIFKNAYILSDYFITAIFEKINYSNLIRFFLSKESSNFKFRKAKILEFNTNQPLPVQIDGEYIEIIPKKVFVTNKTIKFILP